MKMGGGRTKMSRVCLVLADWKSGSLGLRPEDGLRRPTLLKTVMDCREKAGVRWPMQVGLGRKAKRTHKRMKMKMCGSGRWIAYFAREQFAPRTDQV